MAPGRYARERGRAGCGQPPTNGIRWDLRERWSRCALTSESLSTRGGRARDPQKKRGRLIAGPVSDEARLRLALFGGDPAGAKQRAGQGRLAAEEERVQ